MIYLSYRNVDWTGRESVPVSYIEKIVQFYGCSEHSIYLKSGNIIHGVDNFSVVSPDGARLDWRFVTKKDLVLLHVDVSPDTVKELAALGLKCEYDPYSLDEAAVFDLWIRVVDSVNY